LRASENPSFPKPHYRSQEAKQLDPTECQLTMECAYAILPAQHRQLIKKVEISACYTELIHSRFGFERKPFIHSRTGFEKKPCVEIYFVSYSPVYPHLSTDLRNFFNRFVRNDTSGKPFLCITYDMIIDILRQRVTYELLINADEWLNKIFWHPQILFHNDLALLNILTIKKEKAITRLSELGIPTALMAGENPDEQEFVLIGLDMSNINLLDFWRIVADVNEIRTKISTMPSLPVDRCIMTGQEFLSKRDLYRSCVYSVDSSYQVDITSLEGVLKPVYSGIIHPMEFKIISTQASQDFLTEIKNTGATRNSVIKATDIYHYFQASRKRKHPLLSFDILVKEKHLFGDLASIVAQYLISDFKVPAPTKAPAPTNVHVAEIKDSTPSPLEFKPSNEILPSVSEEKYSDHSNKPLVAALGVGSGSISVGISILLGSLSASGPIGWTLLAIGAVIFVGAILKALYDCNKRKFYGPMSPTIFAEPALNSVATITPIAAPQPAPA